MAGIVTVVPTEPVDRLALGKAASRKHSKSLVLVQCEDYTGEGSWVLAFGPPDALGTLEGLYHGAHPGAGGLWVTDQPCLSLPGTADDIKRLLQQSMARA